jgi:hypothetical protein
MCRTRDRAVSRIRSSTSHSNGTLVEEREQDNVSNARVRSVYRGLQLVYCVFVMFVLRQPPEAAKHDEHVPLVDEDDASARHTHNVSLIK